MTRKTTISAKRKAWTAPTRDEIRPEDIPTDPEFRAMLKRKPVAPVGEPQVNHAFDELLGLVEPDYLD